MREEQRDAFQAQDQQPDTSLYEWCFDTSKGYRTIRLRRAEVESLSAPGQNADEACKAARRLPYIREQLGDLTPQDYQDMLGGEGADWHPLTDPVQDNEARVLWLAACGLREEWHKNALGAHQVIPPPGAPQRARFLRSSIGFEDWRYVGRNAHGVLRFGPHWALVAMEVYSGTVPEALQLLQHHFYYRVQISYDSQRLVLLMLTPRGEVVRQARLRIIWPDIWDGPYRVDAGEVGYPANTELPGREVLQTYFLRTEIVPLHPVTYRLETNER